MLLYKAVIAVKLRQNSGKGAIVEIGADVGNGRLQRSLGPCLLYTSHVV